MVLLLWLRERLLGSSLLQVPRAHFEFGPDGFAIS
jgi:hypothetical protein